eukprot:4826815-Prymnesium_polylepis.1
MAPTPSTHSMPCTAAPCSQSHPPNRRRKPAGEPSSKSRRRPCPTGAPPLHLLVQESGSSWSDLALLKLHSISPRSHPISATSRTIRTSYGPSCQNRHSGRTEAHEHEIRRSWALITSTEAGQQV